MDDKQENARKSEEKFQFYVVSLIFTLLAASIQTATFGDSRVEDALELVGWFALLVAGIVGLWRLEWDPTNRLQVVVRNSIKFRRNQLLEQVKLGVRRVRYSDAPDEDIQAAIADHESAIGGQDKLLESRQRLDTFKYKCTKYSFVVGVISIVLSRSIDAACGLFGYTVHV